MIPMKVCIDWLGITGEKKMLQLKISVINALSIDTESFHSNLCVVNSLNCTLEDVVDILCVPHGNSNQNGEFSRLYVQTNV